MSGLTLVCASDCEACEGDVTGKMLINDNGIASVEFAGALMFGKVRKSAGEDVVVAAGDLCELAMDFSTSRNLPVIYKISLMIAFLGPRTKHEVLSTPETF